MQTARQRFKAKGYGIASITYDNQATLKDFGTRMRITYPMLSDPESDVIAKFRMIDPDNSENNVPSYGRTNTAYPGYFVANPIGVIVERFIDGGYDDRRTGNAVVGAMFPELLETNGTPVKAPHLRLTLGQSDPVINLGARFDLIVDVDLPRGMHVYAPKVRGYRPISIELEKSEWIKSAVPKFPAARVLRLDAIKETVPVYEKKVRIFVDVLVANRMKLIRALAEAPNKILPLTIEGRVAYQACDAKICYPPSEVPVKWNLQVRLPDQDRVAPENQMNRPSDRSTERDQLE